MRRLISILAAFSFGSLVFSVAPSWLHNKNKVYPADKFISAIGEGSSEQKARAEAAAAISQYFDTKINVFTTAAEKFESVQVSGGTKTAGTQSLDQIIKISSSAEFFCLNYTAPYYDKKRDTFHVLAYINKQDAAKIYKSRIQVLSDSMDTFRAAAKKASEPFNSVLYMQKAIALSVLADQYIRAETTIVPSDAAGFESRLAIIKQLPLELDKYKKHSSFSVKLKGSKAEKFKSLTSVVSNILEKRGYIYKDSNAHYAILIDIDADELMYEIGPFVKPSLKISVNSASDTPLYSYSQTYSRTNGKTMDIAYHMANAKIKKDLEANFLPD